MARRSDIFETLNQRQDLVRLNIHISRVKNLWSALDCSMGDRLRFMSSVFGKGSRQFPFVHRVTARESADDFKSPECFWAGGSLAI